MPNIRGDRQGAVIREFTKIHEEVASSLDEIIDIFNKRDIKGELVYTS